MNHRATHQPSISKENKIASFDPNGIGEAGRNLFGLPFTEEEAEVIVIPVPWEVTVSYSEGTADGPQHVLEASPQLDLFDPSIPDAWKLGIAMEPVSEEWYGRSRQLRARATEYISWLEQGSHTDGDTTFEQTIQEINSEAHALRQWLKEKALGYLDQGKMVGLLGGDHSTPIGMLDAMAERYPEFGILHFDAHADLREAYEGFEYSHASIMYNALKLPQVTRLVQVGIRDQCQAEAELVHRSNLRVMQFYDHVLREQQYEGRSWAEQCEEIIFKLPEHVYISFDIDGLDPKLCPNTGTPVPGGLEFGEAVYLIRLLAQSGKKIIGFDLVEVAPGEDDWNGNVAARLLYKLCNLMAVSQGRLALAHT